MLASPGFGFSPTIQPRNRLKLSTAGVRVLTDLAAWVPGSHRPEVWVFTDRHSGSHRPQGHKNFNGANDLNELSQGPNPFFNSFFNWDKSVGENPNISRCGSKRRPPYCLHGNPKQAARPTNRQHPDPVLAQRRSWTTQCHGPIGHVQRLQEFRRIT